MGAPEDFFEDLRKRIAQPLDPAGVVASRISECFDGAGTHLRQAAKALGNDIAGRIREQWVSTRDYLRQIGRKLEESADLDLGALADKIEVKEIYRFLNSLPPSAFMEEPKALKPAGSRYFGRPVYFINGIWTTEEKARETAKKLADQVERPVHLIYNPSSFNPPDHRTGTPGIFDDIAEAACDRIWPLVTCTMQPALFGLLGVEHVQANVTTRQVTHVLYHAEEPVSVVSHSQGCIIVRNACFALFLLRNGRKLPPDFAWVATGSPLNDREIWPKPCHYRPIRDPNDPVVKFLGLEGWSDADPLRIEFHHNFVRYYLTEITPQMIDPRA